MKKVISVFLCVCLLFLLTSCHSSKNKTSAQIIEYNLTSEPKTLDPQVADDDSARLVVMNLFEGLVRLNDKGQPTPGVATDWTVSDNYTIYSFTLRSDAQWTDGSSVTANDFAFAFRRAVSKNTASPAASELFAIENAKEISAGQADPSTLGIDVIDSTHLKIHLSYSDDNFFRTLASAVAMPCNQKFFNGTNGQYGCDDSQILSNGPFKFRDNYGWAHGEYLTLRANDHYHGNHAAVSGGVNLTIGGTVSDVIGEMSSGKIDASFLPSGSLQNAKKNGYNLTSFSDTVWALSFNLSALPLTNENVRKSLIGSINRQYTLASLPQNCKIQNDLIPDSVMLGDTSYRKLAGKNLLMKPINNSVSLLNNGLSQLNMKSAPSLTVLCLNDPESQKIASNLIQTWNQSLGLFLNKNTVSRDDLENSLQNHNFQIAIAPIQPESNSPVEFLKQFTTGNTNNFISLKNSDYDGYVTSAEQSSGEDGLSYDLQAEHYLNDHAILYPFYLEDRYFASVKNVTGVIFYPYNGIVDFSGAAKVVE
ncbi:MAG: peptide ABC transporter substrate-binding protein [Bacillota bacterium]|nr:peptide ABC transporter substrate-binding protein [Bacillota bacterium]